MQSQRTFEIFNANASLILFLIAVSVGVISSRRKLVSTHVKHWCDKTSILSETKVNVFIFAKLRFVS